MNTCIIEINEKEYQFCLTREAIKWLESRGVDLQEFNSKVITYIDEIWMAGLLSKHAELSEKDALQLMKTYQEEGGNIMEVINFLVEEYANFIRALAVTESKKKAKIVKA